MGGCCHNPGSFSDMMEEHKKKGFSDRMDRELGGNDGKPVRQPGWAELGVMVIVFAVLGVLVALGVFG